MDITQSWDVLKSEILTQLATVLEFGAYPKNFSFTPFLVVDQNTNFLTINLDYQMCDTASSFATISSHSIASASAYAASFHSCDILTAAAIILLFESPMTTSSHAFCFCLSIAASTLTLKAFLGGGFCLFGVFSEN